MLQSPNFVKLLTSLNVAKLDNLNITTHVATLTLGSRPKQRLTKVRAKNEA